MSHPQFYYTIREVWSAPLWVSKQFILCKKLKSLKAHLKELYKVHFSQISNSAKMAQDEYGEPLNLLLQDQNSIELRNQVKKLRAKANFLQEAEHLFFQ